MRLRILAASACALLASATTQLACAQPADAEWQLFEPPAEVSAQATAQRTTKVTKSGSGTPRIGITSFSATSKQPWEEYDKQVKDSGVIGTLGPDLFGDTVEYYKNTLSFSVTDISLPGNFALPVALTRKMAVTDRRTFNNGDDYDHPLHDWDLDIPNISGVYAPTWADNRCSSQLPPTPPPTFQASDFWNGLTASMPGGGELLIPSVDNTATQE